MKQRKLLVAVAFATLAAAAVAAAGWATATSGTSSTPVDVTNDVYANNEESLGMSPNGQWLAGAWNDWEYNDGCGFSYSTDGGDTWAHESFAPFTAFSNTPGVDPIFPTRFAVAGDPAVVFNPRSNRFDVICQAFGTRTGNQIQLLSETFDPTLADPNADENLSYGRAAWTPPVAIATGHSNGSQKGSNGQFPDHEAVTVDTGTGAGHHFGRLFVAWAEFSGLGRSPINISYSDDDGAHWTGPIRVSDNGHQFDQDAIPRVGPDGAVYVSWINGPNEKSLKNNVAMIDKSTDGGATWGPDRVAAPIVTPIDGVLPNSNYRVFTDVNLAVDQQSGTRRPRLHRPGERRLEHLCRPHPDGGRHRALVSAGRGQGERAGAVLPVDVLGAERQGRSRLLRPQLRSGRGQAELRHARLDDELRGELGRHPAALGAVRRRSAPHV